MRVLALFGPTAVGKTDVAIALAEQLRERGEAPVAVSCDALQVYRGLETLAGTATAAEQGRLEHRLVSFVPIEDEFSAGRFAELAHAEIDGLLGKGTRPIVVGGTGLYLRAGLAELDLRRPVDPAIRAGVERRLAELGPEALHRELEPAVAGGIHPRDRRRVARALELQRAGDRPPGPNAALWSRQLRRPTTLVGLTMDRDALVKRIDRRADAMVAAGARTEVERADAAEASRTARAAIGFGELLAGDVEAMKRAQRAYAKRQMTWMRRLEGIRIVDRTGRGAESVAEKIMETLRP